MGSSLDIKERHYGKGSVQTTAALVNLAGVYSELGEVARGRCLLESALDIEERHFGVGHVETAITLNNLALACGEGGDVPRMQEVHGRVTLPACALGLPRDTQASMPLKSPRSPPCTPKRSAHKPCD